MKNFFENLRILELGSVLAAPAVGQFFAELGAKVLKVENPHTGGDVTRSWKLPQEEGEISAYFASTNWGKTSVFLDLKKKEHLEKVYEILKETDVVISNFKVGDDLKLGLDYNSVSKINTSIIYGQITGYQSERVGYDAIVQAEAGFIFMNGEADGQVHKMPVALVDLLAAHQLKEAILLGLLHKTLKNEGSYWKVSLFDAAVASLANQATNWLMAAHLPMPMGSEHPNIVPYGTIFSCKNGQILLAVGNDKQFSNLCHILEISELSQNPKFVTNAQRVKNRHELIKLLKVQFLKYDYNFLLHKFEKYQIPAGSVNNMRQVFEQEEAKRLILGKSSVRAVRHFVAQSNIWEWIQPSEPPKV